MALIRYRRDDPWKMLETLQEEINRLFDFSFGKLPALKEETLSPSVDVWEDKDNIYVEADLPGFEQKDIKVSIKSDSLSISAKKEETKEEKKKNYYRCERFQGSFYRELDLPSSVDTSKIKANYKNGVLKITLPKIEKEKEKEINIEVE
jgi:HSP20 family protein